MMHTLTESEIIDHINQKKVFEAELDDGSLRISIKQYVPFIATSIHAGSNFAKELETNCHLSKKERYYEEDPFTDQFISGLAITLVACNSRYAYDLNRMPENCIYDQAWGKKVWKKPLDKSIKEKLLLQHQSYYRILKALLTQLESAFKKCYLFDIHSYNYKRIERETPVFNIGSHFINKRKFKSDLNLFCELLNGISLPNIDVNYAIDDVFYGKAYQAQFVSENFNNTLLLPIEVKKIYMDELTETPYPLVIEAVTKGLQQTINAFIENAHQFKKSKINPKEKNNQSLFQLDKKLYQLSKKVDVLYYVNPINYETEKRKFFQKKENYQPQFKYRQLRIDPFEFRENLYKLPVSDIESFALRSLYRQMIESISLDVDLITSIDTENFFYNSLRAFGEPTNRDIDNAKFLLYAPVVPVDEKKEEIITDSSYVLNAFSDAIKFYNIDFTIKFSDQIIAKAMVDNGKKEVILNKKAKFNQLELDALIHHEIGVHALTTINAELQPLSVLRLGLPNNTHTQEGLAIYSEYLSGNLTLKRLQELALRVIAVDHMIKHQNFVKTYQYIMANYHIDKDVCFRLISRVYRGGGFSKDFLYLSGLRDILQNKEVKDFNLLFSGKVSLKYLGLLTELEKENWVVKPKHIPLSYQNPKDYYHDPIINYLISGIR